MVDIYIYIYFHGMGVIIIFLDVAKECLFCMVGPKEYFEGGAVKI